MHDHIYLNADLTPKQHKLDYDLQTELRRHRVVGKVNSFIRNGQVYAKKQQPMTPTAVCTAPVMLGSTAAP